MLTIKVMKWRLMALLLAVAFVTVAYADNMLAGKQCNTDIRIDNEYYHGSIKMSARFINEDSCVLVLFDEILFESETMIFYNYRIPCRYLTDNEHVTFDLNTDSVKVNVGHFVKSRDESRSAWLEERFKRDEEDFKQQLVKEMADVVPCLREMTVTSITDDKVELTLDQLPMRFPSLDAMVIRR